VAGRELIGAYLRDDPIPGEKHSIYQVAIASYLVTGAVRRSDRALWITAMDS
jgi:hypothetical protein